jgi:hypothetical protein
MSIELETTPLAPRIASLLAGLRLRIRGYVWSEGLAAVVMVLGLAFWSSLVFDWLFEPPWQFRALMVAVVAALVGYVIDRFILRRVFRPIDDKNLAVLLERRFRDYRDSLLTTVELGARPDHATEFNPEMLARTRREAARRSEGIRLTDVFRVGPLVRKAGLAAALALSVIAFAVVAQEAFGVWTQRVLLLNRDVLWPRANHVRVVGFKDHTRKVAKGSNFEVTASADLTGRFRRPETVQIRYRTEEGTRGRDNMSTVGAAGARDTDQKYSYQFKGVMSSIDFDVFGGDDRDRGYRIEVVDNPAISQMQLDCQYPAYIGRAAGTVPASGIVQLPMGTKVTIRCEANKDLVEVPVAIVRQDQTTPLTTITLPADGDRRHFELALPELMEDVALLFDLHDADEIRSRDPVRLVLVARPDEVPIVALRLHGISTAVTPEARLPVIGEVRDDYGLTRLWYDFQLDKLPGRARVVAKADGGESAPHVAVGEQSMHAAILGPDGRPRSQLTIEPGDGESLDLQRWAALGELLKRHQVREPVDLERITSADERSLVEGITTQEQIDAALAFAPQVGDRVMVALKAADNCALPSGANIGQGERYQLDVVAPEQLLSMLEGRELMLRRQFEIVYQEMADTRDGLARIDFSQPDGKTLIDDKAGAEPDDSNAEKSASSARKKAAGAEPGDQSGNEARPDESPKERAQRLAKRALELRDVQVARGLDNGDRSAHETLTVADSFDDIREEMVNNRVDTPELQTRLKDQIADPLRHISQQMFPELRTRLAQLRRVLDDPAAGRTQLKLALDQSDAILVEMKSVLDKMLELETFNEVVDTLRSIISEQEKLNQETLRRQKDILKDKLRDLQE